MKKIFHADGRRLVFRLESTSVLDSCTGAKNSKVNSGAFRCGLATKICREVQRLYDDEHATFNSTALHPSPSEDAGINTWWSNAGCLGTRERYVFGFRDMDQLTNWFMWPEVMASKGVLQMGRIGVYAVPAEYVQDGQFQTIFDCTECELVAELSTDAQEYKACCLNTEVTAVKAASLVGPAEIPTHSLCMPRVSRRRSSGT
jgi:hypothetical protein